MLPKPKRPSLPWNWAVVLIIAVLLIITVLLLDEELGLSGNGQLPWVICGIALCCVLLLALSDAFGTLSNWLTQRRWLPRRQARQAADRPDAAPAQDWGAAFQLIAQDWRQRPAKQRPHWLLLCGAPEAVHQAVPALHQAVPALARQPWLETDGMVLIDASAAPPPGGWRRLRGRWRTPADAVIALLPDAADAAALAERAEQLSIACGWTLPLTLCQRAPDNAGPGIAGWPLPTLPANADGWAAQARAWADQLPLRGMPRHPGAAAQPFLLRCSQWLERELQGLASAWQRWRDGLAAPSAVKALALATWPADVRLWSGAISQGSAFAPRRRSRPWQRRLAAVIGALCLFWLAGMLVSAYQN
ncbi:hypothetical protein DB032_23270, partial [Chromobacterium sp. Panama]|uniref:hypothetical protein n=1 Tax=Chromobacterium sp. Panama TaxID=2161826 RepID=UPI000D45B08A